MQTLLHGVVFHTDSAAWGVVFHADSAAWGWCSTRILLHGGGVPCRFCCMGGLCSMQILLHGGTEFPAAFAAWGMVFHEDSAAWGQKR